MPTVGGNVHQLNIDKILTDNEGHPRYWKLYIAKQDKYIKANE